MIKSSKHILKFSNKGKIDLLNKLESDYKALLQEYINLIINEELPLQINLSSKILPYSEITHSIWKQVVYKQASEIVRSKLTSTKKKVYSKYKYLYAKSICENKYNFFTSKKFRELNINYFKRIKEINIQNISINLNINLFNIQYGNSFNEFIRIYTPYFKQGRHKSIKIKVPIKHHKQSNKFIKEGWNRKNTIQLKKIKGHFYIVYFWEKEDKVPLEIKRKIGIDVGYNKLISSSSNIHYGTNLKDIYIKISNKKQGSKSFKRALIERNDKINKSVKEFVKQEDFDIVYIENLIGLRNKKGNKINRWSYSKVFNKLDQLSRTEGFLVETVDPKYTSQTCSSCGNIDKRSRNKEFYQCINCNLKIDADYNASINILRKGAYGPSTT